MTIALLIGLAAFYIVQVVRVLVPRLVERGVKPWSCNLCMSFWSTLLVCSLLLLCGWRNWIQGLAGAGVCLLILKELERRSPPPPPEIKE